MGTQLRAAPGTVGLGDSSWGVTSPHTHSLHGYWVKICLLRFLFVCGRAVHSLRDLSSLSGTEQGAGAGKAPNPNHWATKELLCPGVQGFLSHDFNPKSSVNLQEKVTSSCPQGGVTRAPRGWVARPRSLYLFRSRTQPRRTLGSPSSATAQPSPEVPRGRSLKSEVRPRRTLALAAR